jgi:hypothetical protein
MFASARIFKVISLAAVAAVGLGLILVVAGSGDHIESVLMASRSAFQALTGILAPLIACCMIFLLPLRWMPLAFGWLLMAPLFLMTVTAQPHFHEGNNAPFDQALTLLWWFGVIVIACGLCLVRLGISTVRGLRRRGTPLPPATPSPWLPRVLGAHAWIFAAFVALLLQFSFVQLAQGVRPAWIPHLALLAVGFAAIWPWSLLRAVPVLQAALSGFGGGVLVCLLFEIGFVKIVATEADRLAAGRPYCLQTAEHGADYEIARSPLDFSALTMQAKADGLIYLQHHAVLVIHGASSDEILHWSYNRRTFLRPDGNAVPVIHCDPKPDFVEELTWFGMMSEGEDAMDLISMHGRSYLIPAAYQPRASEAHSEIRIGAMAPDFAPLANPPEMGMDVLLLARLDFEPENWRNLTVSSREKGVDAAPEYGLAKRTLTSSGFPMTQYYDGDLSGIPDVFIECQPRGCIYLFIRNGLVYYFEGDSSLIPQWKTQADRLEALFLSWEVTR